MSEYVKLFEPYPIFSEPYKGMTYHQLWNFHFLYVVSKQLSGALARFRSYEYLSE